MRDSQIESYTNTHIEKINSLNGNSLNYYIVGIIEEIGGKETIDLGDDNFLDISDDYLKLDVLESIFNNIVREEDKILFAEAVSNNASILGIKIAGEFTNKLNQLQQNKVDNSEAETSAEETEEELEEPSNTTDFDSDTNTEETTEENEEEPTEEVEAKKEEENIVEGPAITEYKKETEELEKELEELKSKLGKTGKPGIETESSKEMDEILNNTSFPEISEYETKIEEAKKEIENIDKEISTKTEEKARYEKLKEEYDKYYVEKNIPKTSGDYREKMAIYEQRIKECEADIKSNTEKKSYKEQEIEMLNGKIQEVNGPLFVIEKWKFSELYNREIEELENTLKEITEVENSFYKEMKGVPLEIYGMKTKLQNQIKDMKEIYTKTTGIRSDLNLNDPQFKPILDAVKSGRKVNNEVKEQLNGKYKTENPEKGTPELDNTNIEQLIAQTEKELAERKENIDKYYDALKDIKDLETKIKSGKSAEELKEDVEKINQKIDSITSDKLKEELKGELEKALNPEKTQKPGDKKNDPNKRKKWLSGIAGLAFGAGLIALTPLTGIGAGLAIAVGAQLAKKGVNVYHNHLVKKSKEMPKENEVTNIEKTGKLAKFTEKIKGWFLDENIVKNINWFLNGTSIGAISMGLLEASTGMNYGDWGATKGTGTTTNTTGNPTLGNGNTTTPTDPYSNVKIGDNASGLDLSKGYDQANWASQNINAESLNQTIMQDGHSVIDSVRVTKDGVTHVVDTAGQSLTDIAQQFGVNPEDLVMNITNEQGAARAWVDAAEAVGRTL